MAALNERKIEIVRTLVETAPDTVVGNLQKALEGTSDASALGSVRRMVEDEVVERTLRNRILAPLVPVFGPPGGRRGVSFPSRALALLWRALRETEEDTIEEVRANLEDMGPPQSLVAACEKLTQAAARGVREREIAAFRAAAEACDEAFEGGGEVLAGCLEMAPIVRRATERLREWMTHPGGETTAAARLAYKDCVQIADDAGPRFFEILAAHLPHPWMVLRIISAVMDKPNERYLADSELAVFGEEILDDVDALMGRVGHLDVEAGPAAGREAAGFVDLAVQQVHEVENNIDLDREHGWGHRLHKQRTELAAIVERRLKAAEKAVGEALPAQRTRRHRALNSGPSLEVPPDPRLVGRAITLLTFAEAVQSSANYGGFAAARTKFVETVGESLDHYVDEVIDRVRMAEVEDPEIAAVFLKVAADFNELVRGAKAGELVRRRAHTALHPEAPAE